MTPRDHNLPDDDCGYECIEPTLGEQIWRLGAPDCPAELRPRLEAHLRHCAHCRLELAIERRVGAELETGGLRISPGRGGSRKAAWFSGAGVAALAAGLALLLLAPPRAAHQDMIVRGDDQPAIERPVPDEVVRGGRPQLRWTELAGANRYQVRITMVDGGYTWTSTTTEPQAAVPEGMELPVGARFRAEVEPIPAHAAPDGALRTSFRTGDAGEWFSYRLRRGAPAGRWLAGAGVLGALTGLGLGLLNLRRR